MEQFKEFVVKYFKIIVVVLSFSLTLYIQHVNNTAQIAELETKCIGLEVEIKNQYDRINAMKLDKSVFEATMMQLNTVQNDLHEIRADIRELLKCQTCINNPIFKLPVMTKNTYVKIIASPELSRMKLGGLAGRRGLVVEDLSGEDRKNKGGLVLLEEAYMDEFVWFIPEKSVTYE